jgi:hypothetical protein
MSSDDDMHARHDAVLAELQADGLAMARALKAEFEAAVKEKDREGAARLSGAWHRITRSLRQTLALEALLTRQRARDGRDADDREGLVDAMVEGRVRPHTQVGGRLVWHENDLPLSEVQLLREMRLTLKAMVDENGLHTPEHLARIEADPEAYLQWLRAQVTAASDELEHREIMYNAARNERRRRRRASG